MQPLNELALFAGAGGGILGGLLCGFRTVCAVEWDAYARDVLVARQNDGSLHPFPVWDDIQTFDGRPWRGRVDVVSGGFPCQDISAAGKGAGITGERSGLWKHMARVIGEVLPQLVLVENSPMLVGRGLAVVIADLAEMGYDARWGIVGAHHAGAPHKRDRIWIVANAANGTKSGRRGISNPTRALVTAGAGTDGGNQPWDRPSGGEIHRGNPIACGPENVGNAASIGRNEEQAQDDQRGSRLPLTAGGSSGTDRGCWWEAEPDVGRVAYGVACRVDRLRCLGNGQVPAVVPLAWAHLSNH